jgi:hypothetical protein
MCIAHGGGDRCQGLCCTPFAEQCVATHYHPGSRIGLCTHACRQMVIDARIDGDNAKAAELEKYFKFIELRAESVFLF